MELGFPGFLLSHFCKPPVDASPCWLPVQTASAHLSLLFLQEPGIFPTAAFTLLTFSGNPSVSPSNLGWRLRHLLQRGLWPGRGAGTVWKQTLGSDIGKSPVGTPSGSQENGTDQFHFSRSPHPADVGGLTARPMETTFPSRPSGYSATCLGGQLPAHSPSFPGPVPSCALTHCAGLRSRSTCVPGFRTTFHLQGPPPHSHHHSPPTFCRLLPPHFLPFRAPLHSFLAPLELDDLNARPSAELSTKLLCVLILNHRMLKLKDLAIQRSCHPPPCFLHGEVRPGKIYNGN